MHGGSTSRRGRMEPRHFARDVSVSRQQALDGPLGEDMQAIEGGVQSGVYCAAGVASWDLDPPHEIHQLPTTQLQQRHLAAPRFPFTLSCSLN